MGCKLWLTALYYGTKTGNMRPNFSIIQNDITGWFD